MTQGMQVVEVSPRDGLQNESAILPARDKLELIVRARAAGARRIEGTSFVNPARVPQRADADEVMASMPRVDGVSYSGLVMNRRGLERALGAGVDEVNIVVVATDTFCTRNQGMSTEQACAAAGELVGLAHEAGMPATVTVGAASGCPFDGEVPVDRLRHVLERVWQALPDEVALADTIGVGTPADVRERVALAGEVTDNAGPLRLHLHGTRHTGVANAAAAVEAGVRILDASIGGTGGCPFAPAATGNVAIEDLVYLFERMQLPTGLNLEALREAVEWLEGRLGKKLPGALLRSGGFPVG